MKNLLNEKIETERLVLLPTSLDDKEDIFNEFNTEITQYMFPKPAGKIEETIAFIEESLSGLQNGTNLQLTIYNKNTQEFLGCAGLHHIDKPTPEFGIWLKKTAHGHKYGQEAILGIKERADQNIDYDFIKYPVDKKNIASRKVAEALGAKVEEEYKEKNMSGDTLDLVEYRIYTTKK